MGGRGGYHNSHVRSKRGACAPHKICNHVHTHSQIRIYLVFSHLITVGAWLHVAAWPNDVNNMTATTLPPTDSWPGMCSRCPISTEHSCSILFCGPRAAALPNSVPARPLARVSVWHTRLAIPTEATIALTMQLCVRRRMRVKTRCNPRSRLRHGCSVVFFSRSLRCRRRCGPSSEAIWMCDKDLGDVKLRTWLQVACGAVWLGSLCSER